LVILKWHGWEKIDQRNNLVVPVVHAGEENGYLALLQNISLMKDRAESKGPTARAILEGNYVVCNDIESDPAMKLRREEALARGYRSSISLPILKFGKVIGAFSIYANAAEFLMRRK
jgi:GAF domain-containing protein